MRILPVVNDTALQKRSFSLILSNLPPQKTHLLEPLRNRQSSRRIKTLAHSTEPAFSIFRYLAFIRSTDGSKLFCPSRICLTQGRSILQDPEQISVRIQSMFFRRFNQTVDHTAGLCAARRIGEEPVFAAHHKWLYAALRTVVAQLQTAIFQVPNEIVHCSFR